MGAGSGRTGKAGGKGGGATGGAGPVDLTKMSDGELVRFIQNAVDADLDERFFDGSVQRVILAANMNGKPEIVSAEKVHALSREKGALSLYRTVNANRDTRQSAEQVADDFRQGELFNVGGWNGQAYGGGLYFANDLLDSQRYGNRINANTIGAVLSNKARVTSVEELAGKKGADWLKEHPRFAKKLGFKPLPSGTGYYPSAADGFPLMAIAMGYNVLKATPNIATGASKTLNYYTVFDRSALTTSTKNYYGRDIKPMHES